MDEATIDELARRLAKATADRTAIDKLTDDYADAVREFGAELLDAAGDRNRQRRRHRDHYLGRARAMAAGWCGPGQVAALAGMREDHPNLVAALEWSCARPGEVNAAAALAAALRYHWVVGGYLGEGRRWLDQVLDAEPAGDPEMQGERASTERQRGRSGASPESTIDPEMQGERASTERQRGRSGASPESTIDPEMKVG